MSLSRNQAAFRSYIFLGIIVKNQYGHGLDQCNSIQVK